MAKIKSYLAAFAAAVAVVGALDGTSLTALFPPDWGPIIASILSACAVVSHIWRAFTASPSTTPEAAKTSVQSIAPLLLIAAVSTMVLGLSSCAAVGSAMTGQAIATVPVKREDGTGTPFNVAASDVARAEADPRQAWGLYNAGKVAEVIVEAGK